MTFSITDHIGEEIMKVCQTLGWDIAREDIILEHPADMAHGDYSCNIALRCAKKLSKNPREVADVLMIELNKDLPASIASMEIAGPGFLNFFLAPSFYAQTLFHIKDAGDTYGKSNRYAGQTWVIEHTSPNPNKAMHLGHLRNNLVGMALSHMVEQGGARVIRDMIDNNRGIAIAKLMWGYLKFARKDGDTTHRDVFLSKIENNTSHTSDAPRNTDAYLLYWYDHQDEWQTPESVGERPDRFVDRLYVAGSGDCEKEKDVEARVRQMVIDWEAKDTATWKLWERVIDYSHAGQKLTLERLSHPLTFNQIFDKVWHEHDIYQQGKDLVVEGVAKSVLKELPGGAILTDLSSYNIPDTIVQKSDGTSLYITQDLALTKLKRDTYHADKLFWVIGPDQSLALKQMFAVCEQLDIGKVEDYTHIAYGYMGLKDEAGNFLKMSSRKGNTLFIDDLIDVTKEKLREKLLASSREFSEELLEAIALGAVKFSILRVGRLQDMTFDVDSSIDFEGDSGPYLQYTYARCMSLFAKTTPAQEGDTSFKKGGVKTPIDWHVVPVEKLLYRFPEIIDRSLDEYAPQYIATYLIDLARAFNSWYANTKIIEENPSEAMVYKLAITQAVSIVLKNGLHVLGIEVVGRM